MINIVTPNIFQRKSAISNFIDISGGAWKIKYSGG
jgi:hypothetical protein